MISPAQQLRKVPGIGRLVRLIRGDNNRQCRGVFPTFEQARLSIPGWRKVGYDHADVAEMYSHMLDWTRPTDYATFYWLGPLVPEIRRVFDFGGNLGSSFYSFQKYLQLGDDLRWTICDVPAVVSAGRELASRRGVDRLEFTTRFEDADGSDLLLTSGTLQYVAAGLADLLGNLINKPKHLFVNRTPLTDGTTFYTVQDVGHSKCPYHIHNRTDFVESLNSLGYVQIDSWSCFESSCSVRGRKSLALDHYAGFYFRLDA